MLGIPYIFTKIQLLNILFLLMFSHNLIWQFAGIFLKPDTNKKYYGVGAALNIYQPNVGSQKISAIMIKLESGGPGNVGSVQTGWIV